MISLKREACVAGLLALLAGACGGTQALDAPDEPRPGVVPAGDAPVEGEPPLTGRDPDRDETLALREAMRIAERLRSLRFERPVPVRVQSRADIVTFVRDRIEDDELEEARLFYVAIGLLPADVDLRALVIDVMGEQIAGFYDPPRHTMVVREDVMEEMTRVVVRGGTILGTASSMVLVHEYVHALQDQRLGLHSGEHDDERTIDEANAYAALVEGDATLTMLGVGSLEGRGRSLDDLTRQRGLLRSQLSSDAASGPPGSALASAPAILRAPLMSRYLDGLVFTGALHGGHDRAGSSGFRAIDDAFRDPPTTTEQILHPARYATGDRPAAIALPALTAMIDAGFVALDDETLGELEMSVFFAQGTGRDRDLDAAAGWDGDRIRVLHRPSDHALAFVWLTRWDDEREAIDAETAARRVSTTITTPTGPMQVVRQGRAVSISGGLDATAQTELAASLGAL